MKRHVPRISKQFRSRFAQQYVLKMYRANFVTYKFVGFLKKYSLFWGQKLFVLKWKKIFRLFLETPIFVSKDKLYKIVSIGLVFGNFFIKNINHILSYFLYERFIKLKIKFTFYFNRQEVMCYQLLSQISNRVLYAQLTGYKKILIGDVFLLGVLLEEQHPAFLRDNAIQAYETSGLLTTKK